MSAPDSQPPSVIAEFDRFRAAFEGYAAIDIGAILDALSPGAGASRRKAERIDALARLLITPEFASRLLGSLTPLGRRLLRVACGGEKVSLAALLLAGRDAAHDDATVRRTTRALLDQALLVVEQPRSSGTKVSLDLDQPTAPFLYVWTPQTVRDTLLMVDDDLPPLRPLAAEPVVINAGSFAALRRDLYLVLRFLRGSGLRLTRLGEPHRADLRKLYAALQPGAQSVRGEAVGQREGQVAFMLRLLAATRLTMEEGGHLRAAPQADTFLNGSEYDAARLLYDAWLDLDWSEFERLPGLVAEPWSYSGPGDIPNAGRIARARRQIVALLTTVPDGWMPLADLSTRLRQLVPEFLIDRVPEFPPSYYNYYSYYGQDNYYAARQATEQNYYRGFARADLRSRDRRLRKDQDWDEVEGAFLWQMLDESLRWLGIVDTGTGPTAEGSLAVRLTNLGRRVLRRDAAMATPTQGGAALIVQPNFEVLVLDALGNLDLVSRLDAFADARSLDRAAVYTLSRASIVRGLAGGLSEERIVATLEGGATAPVPQNVRQTIADWAREFERVHLLRDVAVLEAPDAATLDRWLADPALAGGVVRRLTPTVALLHEDAPTGIVEALGRRQQEVWSINYALDPPQVLDLPRPDRILVPPQDDDPYLRYRLARFADPEPIDDAAGAAYRISPESLARARAAGQPIDEILSFLGFKARAGLSPDDVLTLRGWSGYYQPFRYARVRAVELPPTANWGDLSRVKALRPLILRILTANLALIAEECWPQLEAALHARGIVVLPGLSVQPQAEKRSAAQRTAASLGLPTGRELLDGAPARDGRGKTRRSGLQTLNGHRLVEFVEAALDASQPLVIEYQKPSERRGTVRTIEPYELELRGGSYYLHAFCRERQDDRVFRLNNVLGIALAEG
jgi:hypothetical protein